MPYNSSRIRAVSCHVFGWHEQMLHITVGSVRFGAGVFLLLKVMMYTFLFEIGKASLR